MKESIVDKYLQNRIKIVLKYIATINSDYFNFDIDEREMIMNVVEKQVNVHSKNKEIPVSITSQHFIEKNKIEEEFQKDLIVSIYNNGNEIETKNFLIISQIITIGFWLEREALLYDKKLVVKEFEKVYEKILKKASIFENEDISVLLEINQSKIKDLFYANVKLNKKISKVRSHQLFKHEMEKIEFVRQRDELYEVKTTLNHEKLNDLNRFKVEEIVQDRVKDLILVSVESTLWRIIEDLINEKKNIDYLIKLPKEFFDYKTNINNLCKLTSIVGLTSRIYFDLEYVNYDKNKTSIEKLNESGFNLTTREADWIADADLDFVDKIKYVIVDERYKQKLKDVNILQDKIIYSCAST